MGSSILIGGISTFLGVMLLAFSTSTVFSTIFRAFIGMVLLGCSYGLMLLPVVLSLVGPEDVHGQQDQGITSVEKVDETLDVTTTDHLVDSSRKKAQSPEESQTDQPPQDKVDEIEEVSV